MIRVTEPAHGETHEEDDELRPLEERLRRLNWPQPAPGVRERTLAELKRQMAELSPDGDGAASNGGGPAREEAGEAEAGREDPA